MQTDTVAACYIENNDFVVIDGEVKGYVYVTIEDAKSDMLTLDVVDDDGEHNLITVAPFDPVTYVTSFEDEEEFV